MSKKPRGSILKIREFELEKINLVDEFDILQIVGEGWFGKILLVEHRASQTEMVLKAVPKPYVSLRDFYREFHYGLHLGIHRNIVTTYDVAFETAGFYVFTQEYAPLGDLTSNVTDTGVGEVYSKRVARQIASALDYMHSKDIVHRDVKLDNVLIYRSDFSRVKLCDFGESFQNGAVVERRNEWLPYSPPEVLDIKPEGTYKADPSHDVWQFGIVIFVCLTGCLPWQKAASDDPRYMRYLLWQGTIMLPIRRTPKLFKLLSSRAQRMFRRFLEPRAERRPKSLSDLTKFLDDRWLAKTAEKEMAEYETDELCPSMYSFHSSPDEKHKLLYSLADCGIETNVDRQTKKNRIKDWIESSVITEEDEEENEETNSTSPSSSVSREPVPGHISSIRATIDKTKEIKTSLKDAAQKHFDPRTGALQQGPSEMGVTTALTSTLKSASPSMSNISTYNNSDSICASMLTLGSRQDLISSSTQIYTSDINLNLGEQIINDMKPTLSANNLLMHNTNGNLMPPQPNLLKPSDFANKRFENTYAPVQQKMLQRTKSDSLKNAMFASSPAINTKASYNSNLNQMNYEGNYIIYANAANAAANAAATSATTTAAAATHYGHVNFMPYNINSNPNSFIATTTMQQQLQQQQQQQQQQQLRLQQQQLSNQTNYTYFSQQKGDFHVKDSAYGSTDIIESPLQSSMALSTPNTTTVTTKFQQNGNTMYARQDTPAPRSAQLAPTPPQQQQQQQRYYTGNRTASLKDTAYDRSTVQNTNLRKKR